MFVFLIVHVRFVDVFKIDDRKRVRFFFRAPLRILHAHHVAHKLLFAHAHFIAPATIAEPYTMQDTIPIAITQTVNQAQNFNQFISVSSKSDTLAVS